MPDHSRYWLFEHGIHARNLLMTAILAVLFCAYMIGVLIDTIYPNQHQKIMAATQWLYWGSLGVIAVWFVAGH